MLHILMYHWERRVQRRDETSLFNRLNDFNIIHDQDAYHVNLGPVHASANIHKYNRHHRSCTIAHVQARVPH